MVVNYTSIMLFNNEWHFNERHSHTMKISTLDWSPQNNTYNAFLQIVNNKNHVHSFTFLAITPEFELIHIIVTDEEKIHSLMLISIP